MEQTIWAIFTVLLVIASVLQVKGDRRDKDMQNRGQIQVVLHKLQLVAVLMLPYRLLELGDLNTTFLIILYRFPDMTIILCLFTSFQTVAYFTMYNALIPKDKFLSAMPKWLKYLNLVLLIWSWFMGYVCEIMQLSRNRVWVYAAFMWYLSFSLVALYLVTLVCGLKVKRRIDELQKNIATVSTSAPNQIVQRSKVNKFIKALIYLGIVLPFLTAGCLYWGFNEWYQDDKRLYDETGEYDPGFRISTWFSMTSLIFVNWYAWIKIEQPADDFPEQSLPAPKSMGINQQPPSDHITARPPASSSGRTAAVKAAEKRASIGSKNKEFEK